MKYKVTYISFLLILLSSNLSALNNNFYTYAKEGYFFTKMMQLKMKETSNTKSEYNFCIEKYNFQTNIILLNTKKYKKNIKV